MNWPHLARDLFVNFSLIVAFLSVASHIFRNSGASPTSPLSVRLKLGALMGLLGITLMLFSIEVVPSVILDFRSISIIVSAFTGGFAASLISALLVGAFRVAYWGVDLPSVVAFFVIIVEGVGCGVLSCVLAPRYRYGGLVALNLALSAAAVSVLIKDHRTLFLVLGWCGGGGVVVSFAVYHILNYLDECNRLFRRFRDEATKDFLTGLQNVRQFDAAFNSSVAGARLHAESLSLLLLDIDNFKNVNDVYGHQSGDALLHQFADVLRQACRGFDTVSRVGGEEFSVLLTDCPANQAVAVAERIRQAVEAYLFILENHQTAHITASIGVSTYPETTIDPSLLRGQADDALYRAKRAGRNRVMLAEVESECDAGDLGS